MARVRLLIVGQAPSACSDPLVPLAGPSGRRLAALCALSFEEFLVAYERANLLPAFPGKLAKGDAFPAWMGRRFAVELLRGRRTPRRLVLLGGNVSRAFGLSPEPLFAWRPLGRHQAAVCPHPSGISHFWNDPFNVGQARSFWLSVERLRLAGESCP